MRKLKLQMQLSLDGFVARENGELDWMTWNWDDELKNYVWEINAPIDLIVMGRNMMPGFIDAWEAQLEDPESQQFAVKMVETPKIVFSGSLEKSEWRNTTVSNADLTEEVGRLKSADGSDIIAYGGAAFVSSLIKTNLIDEYHLFVNPVAIGKGKSIFGELEETLKLRLVSSRRFPCGVVALLYEPA